MMRRRAPSSRVTLLVSRSPPNSPGVGLASCSSSASPSQYGLLM
ncbi:uncharacterized protein METZ01_LOCUS99539 [marine metagenome]|uniref:Uncharacterized protein n=1 Tax=marine metagenome TaxID=408172 RepID=A0A381W2A9_9ZZZZ